MKLPTTEQLTLVKSFTGNKTKASMLDLFSYSENPIKDILQLFDNQFGRIELEVPNIKREIQSIPPLKYNTPGTIVVDSLQEILLNLKKLNKLVNNQVQKSLLWKLYINCGRLILP